MKRREVFFAAAISSVFFIAPATFAQPQDINGSQENAQKKNCSTVPGMTEEAGRGLNNSVLGWTEIPKKVMEASAKTDPARGLLVGMFQGTGSAFTRTVSGISELATFPIGRYKTPDMVPDMPVDK